MDFYESITKYYDDIFPIKKPQVDFVLKEAKKIGAESLLDIGCATGAFACCMAEHIANISAFDLNDSMVQLAGGRCGRANVCFATGNMLYLDEMYGTDAFDIITCFGNTLVHLKPREFEKALEGIKRHLSPKGVFLMQILNYDYIFEENITELPLIDNDIVTFKRFYKQINADKIQFETILYIKKTEELIKNEIFLYPIGKSRLFSALKKAGFTNVDYYKNYNQEPAGVRHLPLVVKAGTII